MSTRDLLRLEIETTRQDFHALLADIPDEAFPLPSDNPAWTIGEVLYHMSLAPRFVTLDMRMITRQRWLSRLVPVLVPKVLFNRLNETLTRWGARRLDRQFLAAQYDRAHRIALRALESVSDADLERSVQYPDWDPMLTGEVTLARLFHYVRAHFDAHARQIRLRLGAPSPRTTPTD